MGKKEKPLPKPSSSSHNKKKSSKSRRHHRSKPLFTPKQLSAILEAVTDKRKGKAKSKIISLSRSHRKDKSESSDSSDQFSSQSSSSTTSPSPDITELSSSSSDEYDSDKPLGRADRKHLRCEIKILVDNGELSSMALDPMQTWQDQKRNTRRKLIPAIINKLPRYKENRRQIERVLKQYHKTQRRTWKINSDAILKDHNRSRMARNTKINEKRIRRRKALSYMLKAGHKRIKRYQWADLDRITSSEGGNAYHSAEEWHTDNEASEAIGEKKYKLVCIDKWWRGSNARRLFHKRIDPIVKCLQPKNNQLIPRHYDTMRVDNEGMPPVDCPHWFLSEEALCRLGLNPIDFNADYDTGNEDPWKKLIDISDTASEGESTSEKSEASLPKLSYEPSPLPLPSPHIEKPLSTTQSLSIPQFEQLSDPLTLDFPRKLKNKSIKRSTDDIVEESSHDKKHTKKKKKK